MTFPNRGEEVELAVFAGETVFVRPLPASGTVSIGRGEECSIRIPHPSVSRIHASLHVGPRILIEDHGAANATRIAARGNAAHSDDTQDLRTLRGGAEEIGIGDSLMLGAAMLVLRRAPRAIAPPPSARSTGKTKDAEGGAVVADPAMKRLYDQVDRVAPSFLSVLLLGEMGVGKEIVARAIHERSDRAQGPFVAVNCGAITASLAETELFGHEKHAFSDAGPAKPGLFEAAHGGTIFLDEIAELPLAMQVKLLRVLQEKKVMRVGARAARDVDVRVVSATNRDIESEAAKGAFREDLLFRVNSVTFTIPPLRERVSEIVPLARFFVTEACRQLRRLSTPSLSSEALDALVRYRWPGNIRELRNEIERAVVLCAGDAVLPEHLHPRIMASAREAPRPRVASSPAPPTPALAAPASVSHVEEEAAADSIRTLQGRLEAADRRRIVDALAQTGGHQKKAAEILGISLRTLQNRLVAYGIPRPRVKGS